MRYLLIALLFIACGTTQPTVCPTCPGPTTITVHDTTTKIKYDSLYLPVYILQDSPVTLIAARMDSVPGTIWLTPSPSGDDTKQLQAAITWNITHPGTKVMIYSDLGPYKITGSIVAAIISGTDFGQVQVDIEGVTFARNSVTAAQIINSSNHGATLMIQKGKGCTIKNILFTGSYHFVDDLTPIQVDTMSFKQWPDTAGGGSRTSPYSAICIDPFSPSTNGQYSYNDSTCKMYRGLEAYYLPGMDNGGSTSIQIEGCEIENFVVGIMLTPSMQANGEEINVNSCRIDYCKVAYAYSQAQSKNNGIFDLMSWGNLYCVIDALDYGFFRSDGSAAPFIDRANLAGYIHEFLNVSAQAFPVNVSRAYAESLYKIGFCYYGSAGVKFDNCQFHMQSEYPNVPSPDIVAWFPNATWNGGCIREFNGIPTMRLVLNAYDNVFRDVTFSNYPILPQYYTAYPVDIFEHCNLNTVYPEKIFNNNTYDSLISLPGTVFQVDPWDYTGYLISPKAFQVAIGDPFIYGGNFIEQPYVGGYKKAGNAIRISGDTVFLMNIGQGIYTGTKLDIFDCKLKAGL